MDDKELDEIEARDVPDVPVGDPCVYFTTKDRDALIAALREAWAERDEWKNYHALRSRDLTASAAAFDRVRSVPRSNGTGEWGEGWTAAIRDVRAAITFDVVEKP